MKPLFLISILSVYLLNAQQDSIPTQYNLKEVVVSSSRIEIPFSENTRTIQIISSEELKATGALAVADALQQISGVDIRRRGVSGAQADLYIEAEVLIKPYFLLMESN